MAELPTDVQSLLNARDSVKVLATTSADGGVHAIQLGSMMAPDPNTIIFGAVLMKHSGANLDGMRKSGALASVLVCNKLQSYQVRAKVKDYVTSGPVLERMNQELAKMNLGARGVWVLEPVEVWNQSASREAGTRMV